MSLPTDSRYRHKRARNELELMLLDETAEPKALPLSLLEYITNYFSEDQVIQRGASVYEGILENGAVAVERVPYQTHDEKFHRDVKFLMKVKHKNIVRFLGYCSETHEYCVQYNGELVFAEELKRLLCFEYPSKLTLANYITDESFGTEWGTPYQIIKGICQGLHYLHENHIVHSDLKPSNVLLDDNMVPKFSGFGLSRFFEKNQTSLATSDIAGTREYMTTEYLPGGEITFNSNIYSLGVLIFKILSGQEICRNVDTVEEEICHNLDAEEVLERWSIRLKKPLVETEIGQIRTCVDIALKCCEPDPEKRLVSTKHIIERLQETEIMDKGKRVHSLSLPSVEMDSAVTSWTGKVMDDPSIASLDPMVPLLRQIHDLTVMDPTHVTGASGLKKHLEVLCRDLLEPEETSSMPKWWRKEVRQLLYDTEDRLSELIAGVEDACERRKLLQLPPPNKTIKFFLGEAGATCLTHAPQRTLLELSTPIPAQGESTGRPIVGVDEPMNKLVEQLAFDDHNQKQPRLKVVPILGVPGAGKTTAARTLYHKYRRRFQYSAFVRVSRTPDTRSLLTSILSQIKAPRLSGFPDVHDLFEGVKEHLKGKRYFIILDGLWTSSVWDIISRAFPDGDYGSRIITTTQVYDVALACCGYYPDYVEMSPLNDDQSRRLFFTRIFGSYGCPTDFEEVSNKIVKKCAGLPLAIVVVASLLARKSNLTVEKWQHIQDSLPSILRTSPTFQGMNDLSSDTVIGSTFEGLKQVLIFIYDNLPPHLHTCLLYLSMYPEGYLVRKHDLVRQWVAEDFVMAMAGRRAEEIAGSYFDELVSSGMVEPVDTKYGSEVLSCTVHHMVLDLIRHKSKEMDFVITVDYLQSWLALPDEVRRLSIQFGGAKSADIPENILISKVRSLVFNGFVECVPSVVDYVFLRVLILDIWADRDEASFDLTGISELLRLRYLKIQCNIMVNLPGEISRLKHLETLEVDARLSAVPSDIVHLENLLHLLLPSDAILPQGIGALTSLLTLGCFDLSENSTENVIDLAKLTNLQDLRLTWSTIPSKHLSGNIEHLVSVLSRLKNLRSITSHGAAASKQSISDYGLSMVYLVMPLLEKLELLPRICTFSRLPRWIAGLGSLAILKIEVSNLSSDDIAILEKLKSLTALSLSVRTEHAEWIDFDKGFPELKYFRLARTAPFMTFSEGAMPKVQQLKLAFNANRVRPEYTPETFGFQNMSSLTEISIKLWGVNADESNKEFLLKKSNKENAERVFKDAFSNHPNSPIFNIQWVQECIFNGYKITDGEDTKAQDDSRASDKENAPAMDERLK